MLPVHKISEKYLFCCFFLFNHIESLLPSKLFEKLRNILHHNKQIKNLAL
jgi:hypothetical protein